MFAAIIIAEGLRKLALSGRPVTVTLEVGDLQSVTELEAQDALRIAEVLAADVRSAQSWVITALEAHRLTLAVGDKPLDNIGAHLAQYPDLLTWLADDDNAVEVALGDWALELDPLRRREACHALVDQDAAALDAIDIRWRDAGGHNGV